MFGPLQKYQCDFPECLKILTNSSNLKRHKRLHTGERPYKCEIVDCKKTFVNSTSLQLHIRSHTKEQPYLCDFGGCPKSFTNSSNLLRHRKTHDEIENQFKCDECGDSFAIQNQLQIHQREHLEERPHHCDFESCGKSFRRARELIVHKRVHTEEKPYTCNFGDCNAAFNQQHTLTAHIRRHTGEKPYFCNFTNECEDAFTTSKDLQLHIKRRHTGQKDYVCEFAECNWSFVTLSELKSHERIHTGEKPFPCTITGCGSTFSSHWSRTLHVRMHLNLKPHNCDECDSSFIDKSKLTAHKFYHHTSQGQVRKKREENRIRKVLDASLPGQYKMQHFIDFTCMGNDRDGDRCFVDFVIEVKNDDGKTAGFVFLEVDEQQHDWYDVSCELRRMADVQRTLILEGNTFPIMFIRYNPHTYQVNGVEVKKKKSDREEILIKFVQRLVFDRDFSISYMFYDTIEGKPKIFEDQMYDDNIKRCVAECIV